jgi:peptidyl-prolyl cis-trans isomerase B (cyclophilin B)
VAGKKERQRRLARERYERRLAREAQRQQTVRKATQWTAAIVVLLVVIGAVVFGLIGLSGGGKSSAQTAASSTPTPTAPAASPTPSATPTVVEPATHCVYTKTPPPATPLAGSRSVGLPPTKPDDQATYRATILTNRGSIVIDLLNSKATCTVNSFVYLAAKSYFNNTHCHRLTTTGIYVLQCGDPTGTGQGGPGYEFANENLTGATYPAGTLAMANAGAGTNGSQFFLVYQDTTLQPAYTPFGTIVGGINIIQQVAKAGTTTSNGDGAPKEKVVIESVTITKT